ncbi:hypothetical protein V6D40_05090 [Corynebacterium sp. Q4381]|uniref:hypothetical protein n=1 Tax=Corynebacterium sp. Marseille-Q4381 TaxID=3121597 RepID=UPI002FE52D64
MNISYQEVLIFAVIALIIISIVWLIVRIIKGFGSGYYGNEIEDNLPSNRRR